MAVAVLRRFLHRLRQPQRYRFLAELLAHQRLSPPALAALAEQRLAAMIRYARAHTAYYRRAYAGLPENVRLSELPVLEKEAVRAQLFALLAEGRDPEKTPLGHTGGSTGQPLAFWYDTEKHERMRAGLMRSFMLSGWNPGERVIFLWGARLDTTRGGIFAASRIDDWLAGEETLPAHEVSPAQLAHWAARIARARPRLLYGYASVITELARFVLAERIALPHTLAGVYTTAETLTPAMRETIEAAFGAKVFDQYGCREVPNIACECRLGRMHVFTDLVALESVSGRLYVTSLTNRLMPMIRYALGDCGELLDESCPCGLPFPLMRMGIARHNDFLLTPDGRRLHPSFFNRLLDGQKTVRQYQFVQDQPGEVALHLVADRPLPAAVVAAWRERLAREGLRLSLSYVAGIPRTEAGKHRFVICRLP